MYVQIVKLKECANGSENTLLAQTIEDQLNGDVIAYSLFVHKKNHAIKN